MVLSASLERLLVGEMTTVGRVHKCRFEAEDLMRRLSCGLNLTPVAFQSMRADAEALFDEARRLDQVSYNFLFRHNPYCAALFVVSYCACDYRASGAVAVAVPRR